MSEWLEILTVDFVRDKIEEALVNERTSTFLIIRTVSGNESGINHGRLVENRIGVYKKSVKEVVLSYLCNDNMYRIEWGYYSDGEFYIRLRWDDPFSFWKLYNWIVPMCYA